jgi:hypothetical protein
MIGFKCAANHRIYQQEHVPMAIANLHEKTRINCDEDLAIAVRRSSLLPRRGRRIFYPWKYSNSVQTLPEEGRPLANANAAKISSSGPPVIMIEEETFTF